MKNKNKYIHIYCGPNPENVHGRDLLFLCGDTLPVHECSRGRDFAWVDRGDWSNEKTSISYLNDIRKNIKAHPPYGVNRKWCPKCRDAIDVYLITDKLDHEE